MNVYDFDGTILDGDSEFYFFDFVCDEKAISFFKRLKLRIMRYLEKHHLIKFTNSRPRIYKYFKDIKNLDEFLEKYWDKYECHIKDFYYKYQKEDDIISSATPDFILKPIIKRLGVKYLIATPFDLGKFEIGKFNYKEGKVETFNNLFPNQTIDKFYSDSDSDIYLARIAKEAYKVTGNKIEKWNVD